jgi:hypothetical protein
MGSEAHCVRTTTPQGCCAVDDKSEAVCLWEGQEEIGQTILQLEKAQIVHPMHSPYNSPRVAVRKHDDTWECLDYRELNKVTLPVHAAVPSMSDLMNKLMSPLGRFCYVIDFANTFFSINIAPKGQEQFAFTWEG